ncbi:MAG: kynureninase [Phycisphaerae bacterium]|nr:kynureninase [Phycisphaerae bacterium]
MTTMQSLKDVTTAAFEASEDFARSLDAIDDLAPHRAEFAIPRTTHGPNAGRDAIYLCGNSLGLMPQRARALIEQELNDWSSLAVEGHLAATRPWYSYHELFRDSGARLVGALPGEVVMMNSLTVNLHLLMVSFFAPAGKRTKLLIEESAFPSDTYAAKSHLATRGLDWREHLLFARPRAGEHTLRTEDVIALIEQHSDEMALVMLGGVHFLTGQAHNIAAITAAAHRVGAVAGWDLAHAAGNIELALHDWNVDFACWCSYKYLNAGPGAVAGAFVHERHGQNLSIPRFAGWWGNDPATRFQMQLIPDFVPRAGADGWQISNPPIMALAPLKASIDLFDAVGMKRLRAKSRVLTGYLHWLLREMAPSAGVWEVITPHDPEARGCQLSILVHDRPHERFETLREHGVMCDFREPNVIRVAPTPSYNTFVDVFRFAQIMSSLAG